MIFKGRHGKSVEVSLGCLVDVQETTKKIVGARGHLKKEP